MSETFRPWNVDQVWLFPPSVQEFVPAKHSAHFVRETVRTALDLGSIFVSYGEERQRIEPIRTQEWNRVLDSDILRHGVISSGGANRRLLHCEFADYATFKFPPPARRDQLRRRYHTRDEAFPIPVLTRFLSLPKG